mmetsp:Transcript_51611/g.137773  ORF Transcript_51611/g.137773 Transcript_51611/m.137773 type:complete len:257 (-) Transcript_51611:454-1224(-)
MVNDALVAPVVCIHHQGHPPWREGLAVHGEAMVLRGDVATCGTHVDARLVHASIPKLHFVRRRSRCKGQDLVAETDPKNGKPWSLLHHGAHVVDSLEAHLRVAWAIADEETIKFVLGEIVIPRDDCDLQPQPVHEISDDIVLYPAINGKDMPVLLRRTARHYILSDGRHVSVVIHLAIWRRERLLLPARHAGNEIRKVGVFKLQRRVRGIALHEELTKQRAVVADEFRHGPRVDPIDTRDTMLVQPAIQRRARRVV